MSTTDEVDGRIAVAKPLEPLQPRQAADVRVIGVADGTHECNTTAFWVVTKEDASVELDDLVSVDQVLPDGTALTHYGMVVNLDRKIEGASWSSDTVRVADQTMRGETLRCAEVRVLRPFPERWVPPEPAQEVRRVTGEERRRALFMDQMEHRLAVGLDAREQPVHVDFDFVNGRKGGHVNVAGISGVATKTTSLLALLYLVFETADGRRLPGLHADQTRALVVSVKNEELLHIDEANRRFTEEDARRWGLLGAAQPGPFCDVGLYVPPRPGSENVVPLCETRVQPGEVTAFGWTPWEFLTEGLLQYVLADTDDATNQLSFLEQRVRAALLRWAWPAQGLPGAVVLRPPDDRPPFSFERAQRHVGGRRPTATGPDGELVRDFGELVAFLEGKFEGGHHEFAGNLATGTVAAFSRRLSAMTTRIGHLVRLGVTAPVLGHHVPSSTSTRSMTQLSASWWGPW